MYKLAQVQDDRNKFLSTWILVKGELVETSEFLSIGGGVYELICKTLTETQGGKPTTHAALLKVKDADIVWAPPLPTGYYNIQTKPWGCVWLAQSSARQYKVGLNSTVLRQTVGLNPTGGRPRRDGATFLQAALACRDGMGSVPPERAVSMLKKRVAASMSGISPNLAVLKHGTVYMVVYRCTQVVGLVHEGVLHIDNTFYHKDLDNLEHQNGTAKELGDIFRLSAGT